jgi:transcriptional regulator with XRE-family HTH domain
MKSTIIDTTATSKRIRLLMNEIGLTTLNAKCFYDISSSQTFYRWLSGAALPTVEHLVILAAVLGTPMEEIIVADTTAYPAKTKKSLLAHEENLAEMTCDLPICDYGQMLVPDIDAIATGKRINQLRIDAEMTVRDIQKILGTKTTQAVYHWIHGTRLPAVEHLVALAATLGVSMDELIIVDIVVLSMLDGIVLEKKDTKITLATAISLIRAENAKTTTRR